jgi:T6SS immunity protein Tdi1, C-terminal
MKAFDATYSRVNENVGAFVAAEGFDAKLQELINEYGGTSYDGGVYRIFNSQDAKRWTQTLRRFFPSESDSVEAFGRDWQGNVFGLRCRLGSRGVLLFQPGTGDVFEVADSIESFHNEELTQHAEEALSQSLWQAWRSNFPAPTIAQCVGYKMPIFLGGDVAVENLVIADLDVYWDVTGQLLEQVRELPEGTPIKGVKLDYLH